MIATGLCVVFSAAVFAEIGYFNIEKKKEEILIQRRENFPSENAAKTKEIVDAAASTTRNGMRGMCFLFTGLSGAVFMYYRSRHEKSQTALREHMDFMEKEFDDFGDSVRPK